MRCVHRPGALCQTHRLALPAGATGEMRLTNSHRVPNLQALCAKLTDSHYLQELQVSPNSQALCPKLTDSLPALATGETQLTNSPSPKLTDSHHLQELQVRCDSLTPTAPQTHRLTLPPWAAGSHELSYPPSVRCPDQALVTRTAAV